MPVVELTTEQRAAIHSRDGSIALSAGAGCGKTFVLTQRFISHLAPSGGEDGSTHLNRLVAITFTDAAAREMRDRIRQACYEQLTQAAEHDEQAHWQRLLREIDAARVSTIHAYCASLLRANAAAAGLDPLFGVLDQTGADVLEVEVIDDVLRAQLAEMDAEMLALAAAYDFRGLKQQISALLGQRHNASFHLWLDRTAEQIADGWRRWHERDALPVAAREIARSSPARRVVNLLRDPTSLPTTAKFTAARAALLQSLHGLSESNIKETDFDEILKNARVSGICPKKEWSSINAYHEYAKACEELRACVAKHKPKPFNIDAARSTAELGLSLLRLTHNVARAYDDRKRGQGKLDFDDLLFAAREFLADPKNATLRAQLSDDLRLLLVDEFQDTDQLQAQLVRLLCGDGLQTGRLFFVGDFKQSIYRFRGAEPNVFRQLREDIQKAGQLQLTLNFRSQPGILHFVNTLCRNALALQGEQYQALRASRAQTTGPCVEFLWTISPDKNTKVAGAVLEARRQEARNIARRLRGLIDGKDDAMPVVDRHSGAPRRLELGDVAILFRALSDVQVYEEALREYDLDYYLVGGHAFYAQQEIYDVLNVLRAVASTADEVSLAGALRSPFFALADETLFWLVDAAGSLNAGLMSERLPPQLSAEEHSKVTAAAQTMRRLRDLKDRVPIATLLNQALDRTGYDAVLLAEFLGQRKLANLHKLMESARAADHGNVLDLDGFITQLAQFVAREPKEALAATLPEAANVIRLMTIHHAKGLEFPFVVLPDLDRPANVGVIHAALHSEFGPIVRPPSDDDQQKSAASAMSLLTALEKAEELEERKRLLYVACTRAADYLLLSSSLQAFDKPKSDWMELLAERFDLETGALLTELDDGDAEPRIHVAKDIATDHEPSARSRGPDLLKLLDNAHQLADEGQAWTPPEVAPIPPDHKARRQFSFSRLTGRLVQYETRLDDDQRAPAIQAPGKITPRIDARALGTFVHELLARVDLNDPSTIAEWSEHLAPQLVPLNVELAANTATDLVQRFASHERGRQLARAAAVHREVEFLLAWPRGLAHFAESAEQNVSVPLSVEIAEPVYLRGFIDCLYQDNGGRWRLIDYKTDNITAAEVSDRAGQYAMQLYVYAMAAERALGQSPTELVLYFMRPGVEHVFDWNDKVRGEAVEMVHAAIAAEQRPLLPSTDHQL